MPVRRQIPGMEEQPQIRSPGGYQRPPETPRLDHGNDRAARCAMPWVSEVITGTPSASAASAKSRVKVTAPCPPKPLTIICCFIWNKSFRRSRKTACNAEYFCGGRARERGSLPSPHSPLPTL